MSTGDSPRNEHELPAAERSERRALSRRKRWAFRLASLMLPFLLLGICEAVLRMLGGGQDVRLVQPVPGAPPTLNHRLNAEADRPYYAPYSVSGPEARRFQLPKPQGTYRIIVVGASTVIGFPYPPELAFPRQMERFLEQQSPAREFEVLNAGITAINSFAVKDVTRQCLAGDPDLLIVHTGHNEFYGPGGVGSSALQVPPALIPTVFALRRQRLAQVVGSLLLSDADSGRDLIEQLPRTKTIPYGGELFDRAERYYSQNLNGIVDIARSAGVPIVLTTVAGNLRDQSPIGAAGPQGLTSDASARWSEQSAAAETHMSRGEWEAALSALEAMEQIAAAHAVTSYRKARCLEALGRLDDAGDHFRLARDLDPCRFRAAESFREIVRDAAVRFSEPEVFFFDVAAEVDRVSAPYAPGHNLYLEHVHYNLDGHRQVAEFLARMVLTQILGETWHEDRVASAAEHEHSLGITPFDDLAAMSLALQTVQTPPLSEASDAARHEAYLIDQIRERFERLGRSERDLFADLSLATMQTDLLGAIQTGLEAQGRLEQAVHLAEIGVRRQRWSADRLASLARLQIETGRTADAMRTLELLFDLQPDSPAGHALSDRLTSSRAVD